MSVVSHTPLSVSQNFLHDPTLVESLVQQSSIGSQDTVLEIGPGYGIITRVLCSHCRQVIAVEKDLRLAGMLRKQLQNIPNLALCNDDFLSHPLPEGAYKVFSNIPFHITSAILKRLTGAANPPEDAYLVVQKEAAQVYTGGSTHTLRGVLLYPCFETAVTHRFQRVDFIPHPRVDVVLLHIHRRSQPLIDHRSRQFYRDFVVYGFSTWNHTVEKTLRTLFSYHQLKQLRKRLGLSLDVPPGGLLPEAWLRIFDAFQQFGKPEMHWKISGNEARLLRQQKKLCKRHRTCVAHQSE